METNNVYIKLVNIQSTLKAPKSQFNSFGKYNYRSCEDILEGLKPILKEEKALVILDDNIVQIGNRFYVEATATLIDAETGEKVSTKALAREDETKKGMDLAQVTGSVSSYARKYALNGLFCIDDTKDSDATNKHGNEQKKKEVNESELNTLYSLGESIEKDKNRVDSEVYKKFGKLAVDLTKQEYEKVLNGYKSILEKQKQE
ncbi:ERF family protein [Clostridioides difficile]|uniref:Essential recombination function protein n=10 Tax=root TaxID=1 RepID=A0A0A8WG30_9CAUD|nr:ERF family protein [Clostridioides difficile]YP_001110780.1 Erf-like ssDNA annealing protein [Clostridioides phage phiC2]YP_009214250.1 Erf-like ssDNA annealing protein [Clostridium phage phiMMP03]YP_009830931.1 Erf-like ssDNA annealing protein [Clostridium phage CDKM15]QVW56762.1 essential recombination protein [Clostridioides phage phiCD418]ABE99525.1 putative essential recombination function protein [Clostridioides phage phiC2]ANT45203.1 essential recombination function family protein [